MKRGLLRGRLLFVLLSGMTCCQSREPADTAPKDWSIIPSARIGAVTDSTSEQDLVALFGRERVVRRELDVGEGMCAPGSVLYGGTPDELTVTWTDTTYSRPAPSCDRVPGCEVKSGGRWGATSRKAQFCPDRSTA